MPLLSLNVPAGEASLLLASAAERQGYPATAAGVKALVVAYLRSLYVAEKARARQTTEEASRQTDSIASEGIA